MSVRWKGCLFCGKQKKASWSNCSNMLHKTEIKFTVRHILWVPLFLKIGDIIAMWQFWETSLDFPALKAFNKILVHKGRMFTTNQGQVNTFMKAYAAVNRVNLSMNERSRIRQQKEFLRLPSLDVACCHPLRASEHDRGYRQFSMKEAPGLEVIPPLYLKILDRRAKASCWKSLTAVSWSRPLHQFWREP